MYDLYEYLQVTNDCLGTISEIARSDLIYQFIRFELSLSEIEALDKERINLVNVCYRFSMIQYKQDIDILEFYILPLPNLTETLLDFFITNKNSFNRLIYFIVEYLSLNGIKDARVRPIMEEKKDIILGSHARQGDVSDAYIYSRYYLTPLGISDTPQNIWKQVGWEWNKNKTFFENIELVTCLYDVTITVKYKDYGSPFEFDFRPLFDNDYLIANDLVVPEFSLLNKKYVDKYNTIIKRERSIEEGYKNFYSGNGSKLMVLETLDGHTYKIMSTEKQPFIHNYNSGLISNTLTSRPQVYNSLHEERIIAVCFNERNSIIVSDYEKEVSRPLSDSFANSITDIMSAHLHTKLRKEDINSADKFLHVVKDEDELDSILIESFEKLWKLRDSPSDEIVFTAIIKLKDIVSKFKKEFSKVAESTNVSDAIFKLDAEEKNLKLTHICDAILRGTMADIMNNKLWDSIYPSLKEYYLYKY